MPDETRTHQAPAPATASGPQSVSEVVIDGRTAVVPGYQLRAEVGRGGMGVVFRAWDAALDRDVAVKLLPDRYPADSPAARRFVDEARITGQLQHPGIPPVFEVGELADGRPFLAMKLIKGQTLDELLKERADAAADRGRFVAVFEQVCQAVAYAHSKHVIHRDLKPANVMVGAYGEVQVMDWGLAKVIDPARPTVGQADPDETWGTQIRPARDADSATAAGSLLGTPAFMPPEQAAGVATLVDARADVFGLGAILCVILTGKPPYTGDSAESVRLAAVRGKLDDAFARLDACGAELDLIALAKRCLAAEAAERPADAGAVAAAVHSLRAEAEARARRAEVERERAAVREAEGRKRRRVVAAAVVGLVVFGGVAAWTVRQRAEERAVAQARAEEGAASALDQADAAVKADRPADAALAQAAARLQECASPELQARYAELKRDRDMVRELEDIAERRWSLSAGERSYAETTAKARARYAEAFARYGLAVGADDPAAAAERVRAARGSAALAAGLNEWFFLDPKRPGLLAVLDAADPDPARAGVRAAVAAGRNDRVRQLAASIDGATLPPGFAVAVGMHPALSNEAGYKLMRAAWEGRPDSFPLALRIATRLGYMAIADNQDRSKAHEAVAWLRTAIALRPASAVAHNNLGHALGDFLGDWGGAEAATLRAIRFAPDFVMAHGNLVNVRAKLGDLDGALAEGRRVIERFPNAAVGYQRLAFVLGERKEYASAAAAYREAIARDPNNPSLHAELGFILGRQKEHAAAAASCRRALELDPSHWPASLHLGIALGELKDFPGAAVSLRRAAELNPKSVGAHGMLGLTLLDLKAWDEAAASFRRVLELDRKDPYAVARLAIALDGKGDRAGAEAEFRAWAEQAPADAVVHTARGTYLELQKDYQGAADAYRRAIERAPKDPALWNRLGELLTHRLKDAAGGAAAFRRVIELDPKNFAGHTSLSLALSEAQDYTGAIAAARKAIELNSQSHWGYSSLAAALSRSGEHSAARGVMADVMAKQPAAAADPRTSLRYNAACCAVLAGDRKPAFDWLAADLAAWRKLLADDPITTAPVARRTLDHWLTDDDFAPVRDPDHLAKLPADERAKWEGLWADVRKLLADTTPNR